MEEQLRALIQEGLDAAANLLMCLDDADEIHDSDGDMHSDLIPVALFVDHAMATEMVPEHKSFVLDGLRSLLEEAKQQADQERKGDETDHA